MRSEEQEKLEQLEREWWDSIDRKEELVPPRENLWPKDLLDRPENFKKIDKELGIEHLYFNQTLYPKVADEILQLMEDFGFTTTEPFDEIDLKQKIVETIEKVMKCQ